MIDYKIGEWQLGKLKEAIQLTQKGKTCEALLEQCMLIIEAIEHSQPFEAPVVNIPSVWVGNTIGHGESHSRPEDYEGVTTYASTTTYP